MKSILLSIKPEWLCKILNGEKTIEVRKKFPKDYAGWVYLYCSKGNDALWCLNQGAKNQTFKLYKDITAKDNDLFVEEWTCNNKLNGKVVARFWCDKVEEIELWYSPARADNCVDYDEWYYETQTLDEDDLLYGSCLSQENLTNYLCRKDNSKGFAIHISKLEIFDRPKELSEFYTTKLDEDLTKRFDNSIQLENGTWVKRITKEPQNYCYIEGE